MKQVFAKLNSSRGSSMLLALMLVLVGMMVSSTILAAAGSSGKNVIYQRSNQQAYLAVSSAAQAFVDSMSKDSLDFYYKKVTKYNDFDWKVPTGTPVVFRNTPQGPFTVELQRATEWINIYKAAYSRNYTVEVPGYDPVALELKLEKKTSADDPTGSTDEDEIPDKVYQDSYYRLTAVFSNAIPGQPLPETPYQMAVTMEGTRQKTVNAYGATIPVSKIVAYTWKFGNAQIQRVEDVK